MFCEAEFQRVDFIDLRPGDVLIDVVNATVVVIVDPLPLPDDLAVVGVRAFTPEGDPIGTASDGGQVLAIIDDRHSTRLLAARGQPGWRPAATLTRPEQLLDL